ncbi:5-exo-alcohol dehydrogenase [Acrocarpospora phusangensis]|uniref:5-exo-alcohol dehydrogenase n=1 Tax=Acrocarpospora phusangensis TaxID=1070424 RepID=A0A919QCN7_9ACTN|nr:zinc-binding dehydrogenase [Acrocarpospora phusangensis]GIH25284.1 5-exo-alcohol dehydrogenase [Acrocarpospora phusangensis]
MNGLTSTRAAVLATFGESVGIREFPVPPPDEGQIVVAVRYGGVCGTDVHLRAGFLRVPLPLVLGHEGVGTVVTCGNGAGEDYFGSPLRPGDQVMWSSSISCGRCVACGRREPTLCLRRSTYGVTLGLADHPGLSGSWAGHMVLRAGTTVVKLPDAVPPLAAASLACAGPTMVHALHDRRPVRPGDVVVVQGSGPVGLAAAALSHLAGAAQVILVGGPAERLDLAARSGFGDHHLDVEGPDGPEPALAAVMDLTGGKGADLVIECTGSPPAVAQGLRMAARGGAYLVVGQYTDRGDTEVNPHLIVYKQLDVLGSWGFTGAHLAEYVNLLPALTRRFDLEKLVVTYPLEAADQALDDVEAGAVMKAVLVAG